MWRGEKRDGQLSQEKEETEGARVNESEQRDVEGEVEKVEWSAICKNMQVTDKVLGSENVRLSNVELTKNCCRNWKNLRSTDNSIFSLQIY